MRKKVKCCLICGFVIMLLAGVAIWKVYQSGGHARLEANFQDNGKDEPYSQGIPLDGMDFRVYEHYLPQAIAVDSQDVTMTSTVILPCDVVYYRSKEDTEPALTLEKGTEVVYDYFYYRGESWRWDYDYGYGACCWPDYEQEWRYGYPFVTNNFSGDLEDTEMYYVRGKELEAVAEAYLRINVDKVRNSTSFLAQIVTQNIDYFLYRGGVFCSPQLEESTVRYIQGPTP